MTTTGLAERSSGKHRPRGAHPRGAALTTPSSSLSGCIYHRGCQHLPGPSSASAALRAGVKPPLHGQHKEAPWAWVRGRRQGAVAAVSLCPCRVQALSPCRIPVPPKLETRDQHQHLLPEGPGTMMSTMEMPSILHPYGLSCLWGQSHSCHCSSGAPRCLSHCPSLGH